MSEERDSLEEKYHVWRQLKDSGDTKFDIGFTEFLNAYHPQIFTDQPVNQIVVIKDMSAGNAEVGEMWQETKIFKGTDTLNDVMRWGGSKKQITITIPDGENIEN